MDNAFYFILTAFLVLKILKFCSDFFDHVGKWLDNKAKVNLAVTNWITNNYNKHIARCLKE